MDEVTAKSYTLRTESGQWLGQIVLTSNGMYASVTDWGNYSFSWRSFGGQTFQEFLIGLDEGYFANKMFTGISYLSSTKKIEHVCQRYANHILPALKKVLKDEIKEKLSIWFMFDNHTSKRLNNDKTIAIKEALELFDQDSYGSLGTKGENGKGLEVFAHGDKIKFENDLKKWAEGN